MASAWAVWKEKQRQQATGDTKFYKYDVMFFELRIPKSIGSAIGNTFIFPLVLMPDSYSLDEPFALEETPTQGGGLYVEENGIVKRGIRLSGVTGFFPKPFNANGTMALKSQKPEHKSYTRSLPPEVLDNISGQRHFQYLQDAVFRTYADLKRDPALAEETKLLFHVPKDDEHWLVAPRDFKLDRDAASRVMYRYNIELLVLDKATALDLDFSEDKSLLQKLADAIAMVNAGVALAQGAVDDLTAIVSEMKSLVKGIATIIDNVTNVIKAAENFVKGVSDFIESPLAILDSIREAIDETLALIDEAQDLGKIPKATWGKAKEKWAQIGDSMDLLLGNPDSFEPNSTASVNEVQSRFSPLTSQSPETIATAKARTLPGSIAEYDALGTAQTPGDIKQMESTDLLTPTPNKGKYLSSKQVVLSSGDTLVGLAARYLGDGRLWQDIAIFNGLKPPFADKQASLDLRKVDESAMPGVRGIGDKILIPSLSKSQKELPTLTTLGTRPTESPEVRFLGRDFKMVLLPGNSGNPQYDWAIDTVHGGVDLQTVEGVDNLSQALMNRLQTEQGTDLLYQKLGIQRVIGMNQKVSDLELTRFRTAQALQQDSRISTVRQVLFEGVDTGDTSEPDALVIDATVEVRGFTESSNVRISL